ncbi:MAG: hypothetical protein Fur0021_29320 [Candidatus Promineifilaceae bacterium]
MFQTKWRGGGVAGVMEAEVCGSTPSWVTRQARRWGGAGMRVWLRQMAKV